MTEDDDRIEALEQRVQSLEATVEGLTEELVEANERIRALEAGESADASTAVESTYPGADAGDDEEEPANTTKSAESGETGEDTQEESDLDDIIVA